MRDRIKQFFSGWLGPGKTAPRATSAAARQTAGPANAFHQEALERLQAGEFQQAEALYHRILDLDPNNDEACFRLGVLLYQRRKFQDAAHFFQRTVDIKHDCAEAHNNLGMALFSQSRYEDAADCFQMAILFKSDYAEAHYNLGLLCHRQGKFDDALTHYRTALGYKPDYAEAHNNIAYVLGVELGRIEEGAAHLQKALSVNPGFPDAHLNAGMLLQYQGRFEEALEKYNYVLELQPDCDEARLNRSIVWLTRGEFARAWPEYEARKKASDHFIPRHFPYPEWDGSPLAGKTILVYSEQGLGDEIMFASCLPEVASRAKLCVIECTKKIAPLLERSFPGTLVHGGEQTDDCSWLTAAPKIDWQVAMGSLPLRFRNRRSDFPQHQGYLKADPSRVERWKARLDGLGGGLKIGISWRGGTRKTRRRIRSCELEDLLPLLRSQTAHFVSLQYGEYGEELSRLDNQHGVKVHHWREAIEDYDENAALVSALDLVISVCTAVIHLGGALGRPVWVMVPSAPEWRYQNAGEEMPWYPSVRLFRQLAPGNWGGVIDRIKNQLSRPDSGPSGR